MKLAGMDGNIFFILGKASQLLKRSGQPEQAKEMADRVYRSGDYGKACLSSASMWKPSCR